MDDESLTLADTVDMPHYPAGELLDSLGELVVDPRFMDRENLL